MSKQQVRLRVHTDGRVEEITLAVGQNILDAALSQGVDLDHACGGVCACSTCHVKIHNASECFSTASDDEEDQLDEARDVALESRLGCQATLERVPESGVIEITIPTWNTNAAQEGH